MQVLDSDVPFRITMSPVWRDTKPDEDLRGCRNHQPKMQGCVVLALVPCCQVAPHRPSDLSRYYENRQSGVLDERYLKFALREEFVCIMDIPLIWVPVEGG